MFGDCIGQISVFEFLDLYNVTFALKKGLMFFRNTKISAGWACTEMSNLANSRLIKMLSCDVCFEPIEN